MFFNHREFVRGSDGRIYEIRDTDAEGGIFFFFIAVFIAIVSAVYTAYLWLLSHYIFVASISLVGFITWAGWVYHEYQQKEGAKEIGYKILSLLLVFAGFSMAVSGFTRSLNESNLRKKIQGEWSQTDANVGLTINETQFVFNIPDEKVIVEASYQSTFILPGVLEVHLTGKLYRGVKLPSKGEPYSQNYQCSFDRDNLRLWGGGKVYMFARK